MRRIIRYLLSVKKANSLCLLFAVLILTVNAQNSKKVTYKRTGTASFYNKKFTGRRTSSGEKLDNSRFTAAHPSIPFGTLVRVTNNSNGKSVIVKINDRFYPRKEHLIDITYSAAQKIDMIRLGMARVTIEVLDITETEAEAEAIVPLDTITYRIPVKIMPVPVEKPDTLRLQKSLH